MSEDANQRRQGHITSVTAREDAIREIRRLARSSELFQVWMCPKCAFCSVPRPIVGNGSRPYADREEQNRPATRILVTNCTTAAGDSITFHHGSTNRSIEQKRLRSKTLADVTTKRSERRWYGSYDGFEEDFRQHYDTVYGQSERDYAYYEPAYRYGYDLAVDPRHRKHDDWEAVAPQARVGWQEEQERPWEDVEKVIQATWRDVKNLFKGDYERYEPRFRHHAERNFGDREEEYERRKPGYRHGYYLAVNPRYRDYGSWQEMKPHAREEWSQGNESAWQDVKDTVRDAWQEVKEAFGDYDEYEPRFRKPYDNELAASARSYEFYEPGYRFGYSAATNPRYRLYDEWITFEPYAQEDWKQEHEGTWNEVKASVRRAWEQVKDGFDSRDTSRAKARDTDPAPATPSPGPITDIESDYERFDPSYRAHFADNYSRSRGGYAELEPAYRLRISLGTRYADRSWEEVEPKAWRRWEADEDTPWDEVQDAVRYGWERVKQAVG